jgi:uncharacterized membrane protein (UPF0182 family)
MNKRIVIIGLVVVIVLGLPIATGLLADWWWFESLNFEAVFLTRLTTQIALFASGAGLFALVVGSNILLARGLARRAGWMRGPPTHPQAMAWEAMFWLGVIGAALYFGWQMAGQAGAAWETVLRFLNAASFGATDPLFGRDVGWYIFSLPLYRFIQGWLFGLLALSLLAAGAIYLTRIYLAPVAVFAARVREQPMPADESEMPALELPGVARPPITRAIKLHLSLLGAALALLVALGHQLDIAELVFSTQGAAYGAGYADVNARWPALTLLTGLALIAALTLLAGIPRRDWRLSLGGFGLWLVGAVLAGFVYPLLVQRLVVQPAELDRERPFIEHNIRLTRLAYGLDKIQEVPLPGEERVTPEEIAANPDTLRNIRLWDPEPLLATYNQVQSIRLYYEFVGVDVDRYTIDGRYRQVMLSARELSPERLPAEAQTWVNRRLQFTHGYGVAMSPVNELTPEGLPTFLVQDVPPKGALTLARPEIYFGEKTGEYVIVRTRTPEFDYPKGDENVYASYAGDATAGVSVGDFFRRLVFAIRFGDLNILLSDALEPRSLILYHRNVAERVQKLAPFLLLDRDPYLVAADGGLYWILDAYTHTDRYPYSQPYRDPAGRGTGGSETRPYNYLRNSVKAVVSAYDGSVTLYAADPDDPILRAWRRVFPDLFHPLDEMPPALRPHLRYPQDLFSAQADLYSTYHMQDPRVFYNKEDLWTVPNEIYLKETVDMAPYYIIMRLPNEPREEYVLIRPYTPPDKNNMITWLAARSDGEHYGKLLALRYPKEKLVFGPMQIEARIDQDPRISEQITLWDQAGSQVLRGNMIVIPIGASNLYVEPLYLQAAQGRLPEMKRVILASGNRVVMHPTVEASLTALLGQALALSEAEGVAQPPETAPTGGTAPSEVNQAVLSLLAELEARNARLAEELDALQADLARLRELLGAPGQP